MHPTIRHYMRGAFLVCVTLLLAACGSSSGRHLGSGQPPSGGGGTLPPPGGGGLPPPPPPPGGTVVVSGVVTFDRVPFSTTVGNGLDFAATTSAPARGVAVEAVLSSNNSVAAIAQTDALGAFSLTVQANAAIFLRVKAEMAKTGAPSWTIRVLDNTAGNALYALDSAPFNTGVIDSIHNLHALSGWNGTSYPGTVVRAAAPFAMLDDIYDAIQLVLSANATVAFPALDVFWSPNNIPNDGTGNPAVDYPLGNIGTTFFQLPAAPGAAASLYVLGAANVDTDEFDAHVIAHEWGHYYQSVFSRDDSVGGDHLPTEKLDMRVAFSEGWSDAFSGMALSDPLYRDSFDVQQATDDGADMELDATPAPGWFSEGSVGLILYDLFDGNGAGSDAETVQVSFQNIHAAMQALAGTDALTTIHSFVNALLPLEAGQAGAITTLVDAQGIDSVQPNDFAGAETHNGGDANNLPIYTTIQPGDTKTVCSSGAVGNSYNKLGNRSFLQLTLAAPYTGSIDVSTPDPVSDADVILYQKGVELARAEVPGDDTLPVTALAAGTYVIETYESSNVFGDFVSPLPFGPICIDVQMTP